MNVVRWSARFALYGPGWLPFRIRKLPLNCVVAYGWLHIRGWL